VPCFAQKRSQSDDPLGVLASEHLQDELKLNSKQKERIREILLQWEGVRAVMRSDIAKELGLRDSQRAEIAGIYVAYNRKQEQYYELRKSDRDRAKLLSKELKEDAGTLDARVINVLTDSQKRQFERMMGEPFNREKLYKPKVRKPNV
jgi:hypothetical protein